MYKLIEKKEDGTLVVSRMIEQTVEVTVDQIKSDIESLKKQREDFNNQVDEQLKALEALID